MRIYVTLLLLVALLMLGSNTIFAGTPYLEMSTSCGGGSSGGTNRYQISDWDGREARAFSSKVYDFSIECNGFRRHVIDLFLATASSDRYRKQGGTLYKHTRDQRKSVRVRDKECRTVYEDAYCSRTPAELYQICRGDQMCELEHSAYDCKKPRQRCTSAKYETRYVPVWEPFPTGYAPLPSGARIVSVATPVADPATTGAISRPADSGPGIGTLFLLLFIGGVVAFVWKPVARFYYTAFVPHPAQTVVDRALAANKPLDMDEFESAMMQGASMPFPDVMAAKADKLRKAMDENTKLFSAAELRERARMRAHVSGGFARDIVDDE